MSWDEKLFHIAYNAIQSVLKQKSIRPEYENAKVPLDEILDRLLILSALVTGEKLEIHEAELSGGYLGSLLLLPKELCLSSDPEINKISYLYRLLFTLCSRELKLNFQSFEVLSPTKQLLATVLAVPLIETRMKTMFPNIDELRNLALVSQLDHRPKLQKICSQFDCLESLIQMRLGRNLVDLANEATPGCLQWIKNSLAIQITNPTNLNSITELALQQLKKLPPTRHAKQALPVSIWGLIMNERAVTKEMSPDSKSQLSPEGLSTGTEIKGKSKERVEEIKLNENELGDNPITHSFEKLHTADEYKGGQKTRDVEDDLAEHTEALDELDLRQIVRTRDRAQSLYKADLVIDPNIGDLEDLEPHKAMHHTEYLYDEWDERSRTYKSNWCHVFVEPHPYGLDSSATRKQVDEILIRNVKQVRDLQRQFNKLQVIRRWRSSQIDGPEIDLDAMTDRYATLKSGHSPSDKLFLSRRRQERDFATLILLDASLSTDSWVQNRRVLDIARESILILGEVASQLQDTLAISAFYSNTRRDCRYLELKTFDEPWQTAQSKLLSLRPTGYTRIGPALRHSIHLLSKSRAKKKLLLLISDGKPTDYDRYEGRYGIEDIRQAIREGQALNIHTKALAIDAQAKFYLPLMFGQANFRILLRPELLAPTIASLYGQILQ